ncbi:MAG: four helix bundle protein [Gemmatimonadota bacterium]|nr:four helix bundle protein [Gemmatimonadota bacterium]MDH3367758.1 four helix bundle protein [Gemmatimonadota bacterium]MDH3477898.1 four helix bundle protein [Gemmatimonadota bacterium]MDH3570999.1 four helix bundle protein [Gemmatimonadota bacterium]MDH5550632.1 four helix bundle protein [Gemmatimonadota bacterium]
MPPTLTPDTLEDRLIDFGAAVCGALRRLPKDLVGSHLSRQLARSATSPAANYAEARGAESRRDFVHKMQICLKELRETGVWLELLHRRDGADGVGGLKGECDELTAIFVSSIKTAKRPMRTNG